MTSVLQQLLDATASGPVAEKLGREALERGIVCIEKGDRDGAAVALRIAALTPSSQLQAHNLIEAHTLEGAFGPWMGLDCEIDPLDDMYGFFTGYGTWSSPLRDYLADGWRTLSELMVLLELHRRPLMECGQMLEFASGHGRLTRHLVKALGCERITVSDVLAPAMDFARKHFGVRTLVSSPDPAKVHWPQHYDLVFVLSLFSHLPQSSWGRWLHTLWRSVSPGGVLVFSTHGEHSANLQKVQLNPGSFHFVAQSESKAIDTQQYGTAFASGQYVQHQIEQLDPKPVAVHDHRAWFWAHQDAFVLEAPPQD